MNYKGFIRNEIKDRISQKGLHKALWNFFMYPFTLFTNFLNYRKWIRLLNHLGLTEKELKEEIQIEVIEEKVSMREAFKKFGETQPSLRMNNCFIIEKDELFIFPYHSPETEHHFFTEIQEPVIIGLTNSKHPFETLWGVPTMIEIIGIFTNENRTEIKLKGDLFKNQIEFRINKKLRLPTKPIRNAGLQDK